ncbi:MAG: FecR family protein [Dehalococcoidia bacterium]
MTHGRDLAIIIDRCLDELVAGRWTVSDCLDRYPEYRAALEPVLGAAAAMHALPRRAGAAPDRIRRAAFMEMIRETPQQRARWWMPRLTLAGLHAAALSRYAAAAAPIFAAAAIGVVLLVGQPASFAAASTLTVFSGTAETQVNGTWTPVGDGASIRRGDRLRTAADGHAMLTFPDGSTASLAPGTEIAIEQLSAGRPRNVQVRQFSGRLWNDVVTNEHAGSRYEIHTQDALVQVQGTVFETTVDGAQMLVSTAEGAVDVVLGREHVDVPRGQSVRTEGQRLADRGPLPGAGTLTIDAPFAAALLSERGEATGAQPDGAMFLQIRGVTTSNPGVGPQRFEFQRLDPGTYTLTLERFGQGGGDIVLNVGGTEHRVPLDNAAGAAQVRVRVEVEDGKRHVQLVEDAPRAVPPVVSPPVRIVETERTKNAPDIATQRAAAAAAAAAKRSTGTATTSPSTTGAEAFAARLRQALASQNAAAIRTVLRETVSGADSNLAQAQLRVLVAQVNASDVARQVSAALATDEALRTQILGRAATALPADLLERLRQALGVSGPRPQAEPSPARTPTPTARPSERDDGRNRGAVLPSPVDIDGMRLGFVRAGMP